MVEIIVLISFTIFFIYFYFVKNNYKFVMFVYIKFLILFYFLYLNKENIILIYICCSILLIIFYLFVSETIKIYKKSLKEFILIVCLIIIVLIFSSCKPKELNMPEINKRLKVKFIPTDIIVLNKNDIIVGSEREDKIRIIDSENGKIKRVINSGINTVQIILHNNILYAVNKTSHSITIHNLKTNENVILNSGGQYPSSLALNDSKNLLYVANMGSSNISIFDLNKDVIINKIMTEKWPSYLLLLDKDLYVACKYTNVIQIIDALKFKHLFTKIETGISPTQLIKINKRLFAIINEWEYSFNEKSAINFFDIKDYELKFSILVDGGIYRGVLSKSGKYLFVTVPSKDKICFVDIKKRKKIFDLLLKETTPKYIALSPDGSKIYITCQNSKEIIIIEVNDLL